VVQKIDFVALIMVFDLLSSNSKITYGKERFQPEFKFDEHLYRSSSLFLHLTFRSEIYTKQLDYNHDNIVEIKVYKNMQ
jgi:hypothetical protein